LRDVRHSRRLYQTTPASRCYARNRLGLRLSRLRLRLCRLRVRLFVRSKPWTPQPHRSKIRSAA
jgi:hypothetical protein